MALGIAKGLAGLLGARAFRGGGGFPGERPNNYAQNPVTAADQPVRPKGLTWSPWTNSYNNSEGQAWQGMSNDRTSHLFGDAPSSTFSGDARAQRPGGNWGSPQLGMGAGQLNAFNQARSFNPWLGGRF